MKYFLKTHESFEHNDEFGTVEPELGIELISSHPHAQVKSGQMTFCDIPVHRYDYTGPMITTKLVIRDKNSRFVCGFDLLEDGVMWLGTDGEVRTDYKEIVQLIHEATDGEFKICEEEPLPKDSGVEYLDNRPIDESFTARLRTLCSYANITMIGELCTLKKGDDFSDLQPSVLRSRNNSLTVSNKIVSEIEEIH